MMSDPDQICDLTAVVSRIRCALLSRAQRLRQKFPRFRAAEILLAGDQVSVSHREPAPHPGVNVVGTDLLHFVFDSPRDLREVL
jgi:hypothetical protein